MTGAKRTCILGIGFLFLGSLACFGQWGPVSARINVSKNDLLVKPPGANWVSYNGDYTGRRYSSLSQITPENVNRLRAQWVFHSRNSQRMEVTPVVVDGIMYVTVPNQCYALDAGTGRELWHYRRRPAEGVSVDFGVNRGASSTGQFSVIRRKQMRDDHERAGVIRQRGFEPFDRRHIEMIGRLVEDRHPYLPS